MIVQNKNVKVKLAKNILQSQFTFLNNKLFFDDLSLTDQALIFSGVKILDLKENELLYVNNLNIILILIYRCLILTKILIIL